LDMDPLAGGAMKHGKKPTVRQAKILQAHGMKSKDWLIERESEEKIVAVHRYAPTTRVISKEEGEQDNDRDMFSVREL